MCPKPWKQRIWLAETDTKGLVAKVVMAMMYARDIAKKSKRANKAKQAKELGKSEGDF